MTKPKRNQTLFSFGNITPEFYEQTGIMIQPEKMRVKIVENSPAKKNVQIIKVSQRAKESSQKRERNDTGGFSAYNAQRSSSDGDSAYMSESPSQVIPAIGQSTGDFQHLGKSTPNIKGNQNLVGSQMQSSGVMSQQKTPNFVMSPLTNSKMSTFGSIINVDE